MCHRSKDRSYSQNDAAPVACWAAPALHGQPNPTTTLTPFPSPQAPSAGSPGFRCLLFSEPTPFKWDLEAQVICVTLEVSSLDPQPSNQ